MNRIIQKSGHTNQTWTKLRAKIFAIFGIANYASKNLQKFTNVSSIRKNNSDLFQNFPMISLVKKSENCKIRHFSFQIADNDLKIWQNHLLLNPFHMIDAKFYLVLRSISHGIPAMPFDNIFVFHFLADLVQWTVSEFAHHSLTVHWPFADLVIIWIRKA